MDSLLQLFRSISDMMRGASEQAVRVKVGAARGGRGGRGGLATRCHAGLEREVGVWLPQPASASGGRPGGPPGPARADHLR